MSDPIGDFLATRGFSATLKGKGKMNKKAVILLGSDNAEFHTIMAALRFYQSKGMGDPGYRSNEIHAIATNGGEVMSSLDDEWIDSLCERINTAPAHLITVTVKSGIVTDVKGLMSGLTLMVRDLDSESEDPVIESVWTHDNSYP